jgi:NAD(P)-dependent dehydrogenase (short-subunit alcohol dehydrogenase family)
MPSDDVYVITGGAGGMGQACARVLADRGQLLLLDVADDQLEKASIDLSAEGARVERLHCDVTSLHDTSAVTERIRHMGPFRALVHTAGLSPLMADGRRVLEVDLLGSIRITDAVFPLVGPGSSAVLIGSIAAYAGVDPAVESLLDDPTAGDFLNEVDRALGGPIDGPTAYVVAKRGVVRLAQRLSGPWGSRGARTVSIAPGLIDTPMGRRELAGQPTMAAMVDATPVKRPGQPLPGRPEDIAAMCAFLVSDGAGFVSGCDIRVDGGLIGLGSEAFGGG